MRVPFLDYKKLYSHYQGVDDAMKQALVCGHMILQEDVEEFERKFAKMLGVKHFIGLASGTDALMLALVAAGVGPGDEVITVSHTFVATIQVIHHLGATPILVDVGEDGLMDMEQVKFELTDTTKAIIPVHLSGDVCDREALKGLLFESYRGKKTMPLVIEDAAQAINAERDGIKAGAWGFAGCFSFYPAKVLGTFGDAGGLSTNDDAVAARVRSLRNHSDISKKPVDPNHQFEFGWNSRLDNVWAAVLNVKLAQLKNDLWQRGEIARFYNKMLQGVPITLPVDRPGRIWQDYVIRAKDKTERDQLNAYLNEHDIGTLGADILANHLHPGLGLDHFKLTITERITDTSIRIPCNHFMTVAESIYVAHTIKEFYGM